MPITKYFILLISLMFLSSHVLAEEPDWTDYQWVLKHVKPGVKHGVSLAMVDYQSLKNSGVLHKAYQQLSHFKVERLSNKQEIFAFYINAYNILALKKIVDHWPINSIKDAGYFFSPVWNKPAGVLAGKQVSLAEIEHEILRPMGDPRIHFAIVCASVSCPNLRAEPYRADTLNAQLDQQTTRFLNNTGKGLTIESGVIRLSKIFDWFAEDFQGYGGVAAFVKHYRTDLPAFKVKANIPYDWALNGSVAID